jgi:hypothetical protein
MEQLIVIYRPDHQYMDSLEKKIRDTEVIITGPYSETKWIDAEKVILRFQIDPNRINIVLRCYRNKVYFLTQDLPRLTVLS